MADTLSLDEANDLVSAPTNSTLTLDQADSLVTPPAPAASVAPPTLSLDQADDAADVPSIPRTVAGTVARNIAPLAAGTVASATVGKALQPLARAAGARAGALAGAGVGTLVPGLDATGISEGIGGIIGGLVGYLAPGFIATTLAQKGQTAAADAIAPDSEFGSKQEAAEEAAHPAVSAVTSLLTLGKPNPFKIVRAAQTIASAEGRAALSGLLKAGTDKEAQDLWATTTPAPIKQGVQSVLDTAHAGAINAAFNAANQIQTGNYSATDLLKSAAEGTLFNQPWIHAPHPETKQFDKAKGAANDNIPETQEAPPQEAEQPLPPTLQPEEGLQKVVEQPQDWRDAAQLIDSGSLTMPQDEALPALQKAINTISASNDPDLIRNGNKQMLLDKASKRLAAVQKDIQLKSIADAAGRNHFGVNGWLAPEFGDDGWGHVTTGDVLTDVALGDGSLDPSKDSSGQGVFVNKGAGQAARVRINNRAGMAPLVFDENALTENGITVDKSGGAEPVIKQKVPLSALTPEAKVRALDTILNELDFQKRPITDDVISKLSKNLGLDESVIRDRIKKPITTGETDASKIPGPASLPIPEVRKEVGGQTSLQQQGQVALPQVGEEAQAPPVVAPVEGEGQVPVKLPEVIPPESVPTLRAKLFVNMQGRTMNIAPDAFQTADPHLKLVFGQDAPSWKALADAGVVKAEPNPDGTVAVKVNLSSPPANAGLAHGELSPEQRAKSDAVRAAMQGEADKLKAAAQPPAPARTEISREQALAIHGGSKKLLPKAGETKPQPSDTTGEYFVGQTADGKFFTEHRPKPAIQKNLTTENPTVAKSATVPGVTLDTTDHVGEGKLFESPEHFEKDYTVHADSEVRESRDEFLKRAVCASRIKNKLFE